jgi:uncharacterized protein (TIGR03083 family)
LHSCYAAIEALCAGFADSDWHVQSLCPDWNLREVVKHVTSIEAVMTGWLPENDCTAPPFERAAEFLAETDDNAVLVDKVRTVFAHRREDLSRLTPADLQRPSWTPTGRGTYGRFLEIRVFDFWVHERDITVPLARNSIGRIVGNKVGLPDAKSLAIRLTGPLVRDLDVLVDGRAQRVAPLGHPEATMTADSTTFLLLACASVVTGLSA